MMSRAPEGRTQSQFCRQRLNLALMGIALGEDLLQCDDIAIEFCKHLRDPLGRNTPVHTASFVDVISDNAHTEILPFCASGCPCGDHGSVSKLLNGRM